MESAPDWSLFRAVLFDMDGVLTATATVHSACWKRMFDAFLQQRARASGEPFEPFDEGAEYRLYVDGRRRHDGVRTFLASRGIELPDGDADSPADEDSVVGLGKRKERMVLETLRTDGVDVHPDGVALARAVRERGLQTAVVSASANCALVLEAAGIDDLFELRVDGIIAAERHLPGKPAPDTFLAAAEDLGVEPAQAVVVEDAISGVQAGKAGGFGLVVGVARHGDAQELRDHGADIAVTDLTNLLP